MEAKILEVRDRGTFVPIIAVDMNPPNLDPKGRARWLLQDRCGYPCDGRPNIMITHAEANGTPAWNDPYAWGRTRGALSSGARTYPVAHEYIINNWASLNDGDVVDVEFILGETTSKKASERETVG